MCTSSKDAILNKYLSFFIGTGVSIDSYPSTPYQCCIKQEYYGRKATYGSGYVIQTSNYINLQIMLYGKSVLRSLHSIV